MAKVKTAYDMALQEYKRVGAARCEGDALLAMTCELLSRIHAVNPGMLFDGAKKKGIDSKALREMQHGAPADFAFLQFE